MVGEMKGKTKEPLGSKMPSPTGVMQSSADFLHHHGPLGRSAKSHHFWIFICRWMGSLQLKSWSIRLYPPLLAIPGLWEGPMQRETAVLYLTFGPSALLGLYIPALIRYHFPLYSHS
jgi:hypothetical protein